MNWAGQTRRAKAYTCADSQWYVPFVLVFLGLGISSLKLDSQEKARPPLQLVILPNPFLIKLSCIVLSIIAIGAIGFGSKGIP